MTQDEEIRRGHEAERLMNEPLLVEAFELVEAGLVDGMKRVAIGDNKTQHELVLMLQLLAKVRGHLKTTADTGKMARIAKESLVDRAKRGLRRAA